MLLTALYRTTLAVFDVDANELFKLMANVLGGLSEIMRIKRHALMIFN